MLHDNVSQVYLVLTGLTPTYVYSPSDNTLVGVSSDSSEEQDYFCLIDPFYLYVTFPKLSSSGYVIITPANDHCRQMC